MESIEEKNESQNSNKDLKSVKLVIPSIPDTYTFSRKCYDHDILSNIITKSEFDKIINKASLVYGDCLFQKKKNDKFEESFSVKITRPLSLFLIFLFVVFFYITQQSVGNMITFIISILFLFGGIGLTIYEGLKSFCRKNRKYYTLQEIIEKNLAEYFEIVNKNLVEDQKQLYFEFIPDSQNIECNLFVDNIKVKNDSSQILNKVEEEKMVSNNNSFISDEGRKNNQNHNNNEQELNLHMRLKENESSKGDKNDRESEKSQSNQNNSKESKKKKKVNIKESGNYINTNTEQPLIEEENEDINTFQKAKRKK